LGVIRVIWASVVCNLDQSRDWLSGPALGGWGPSDPGRWGPNCTIHCI